MPRDMLNRIISDLQALSEQLGDASEVDERVKRAKADLTSINDTKARADAQMKESQNLLTQAQAAAQKQFEQDMFTKQGHLKSLTERVAALEERAKELTEEVRSKGLQLQAIESAFNDARRRLAG